LSSEGVKSETFIFVGVKSETLHCKVYKSETLEFKKSNLRLASLRFVCFEKCLQGFMKNKSETSGSKVYKSETYETGSNLRP